LQAHVTLVSRRQDPPDALPAGCSYLSADVTDPVEVERMLRSVLADGPLAGVFHLAAVAAELPVVELDLQGIRQAMAAKTIGIATLARHLADLSPATPLIAFSSLLTSFHSPLYGAYVAANRYMEAVAERASPQIRCVAWGLIAGLGMSRGKPHGGHALRLGFGRLEEAEIMPGLRLALSLREPVVLVGANPAGSKVAALVDMSGVEDPIGIQIASDIAGPLDRAAAVTVAIDELTAHEMPLLEPIRDIWRELLNVPVIQLNDNFFSLGGDSLELAELHARLCELTHRELPVVPLFTMENLRDVVRYAAGGHGG
jgi:acyl carrier protein